MSHASHPPGPSAHLVCYNVCPESSLSSPHVRTLEAYFLSLEPLYKDATGQQSEWLNRGWVTSEGRENVSTCGQWGPRRNPTTHGVAECGENWILGMNLWLVKLELARPASAITEQLASRTGCPWVFFSPLSCSYGCSFLFANLAARVAERMANLVADVVSVVVSVTRGERQRYHWC